MTDPVGVNSPDWKWLKPMRRRVALFCILAAGAAALAHAQVEPAAMGRELSVTAGGIGSLFEPKFQGDWQAETSPATPCYSTSVCQPVSNTSPYPLFGAGAYVDVRLDRRVQLEAEARWLRFNQYNPGQLTGGGIYQDNYLLGPRIVVAHAWKMTYSAKVLVGVGKMGLGDYPGLCATTYCVASGHFTDLAFGGGADMHLTRRIVLRVFDAEYQYWPKWGATALMPYGVSVGVGYKIF